MKKLRVKKLLILSATLIIFTAGLYLPSINKFQDNIYSQPKQTHQVLLTEDGFSPQEITINKGDAIEFKAIIENPFWPASNLHPTHDIYPEFDPKEPIEQDKSWTYTFEKLGEWKYHDHLSPLYKGKVIVVEGKKAANNPCQNKASKLQCYEELIDSKMKNQGLKEAFETLADLFEGDPQFASSCHDFTHKLGEKAYFIFSEKENFELSDKSSYCGYGFYHGFMETLLQKTADMEEARRFCEYVDNQLEKTSSDAGGACFHGIGHGVVDGSDPRFWGDPEAMITPGTTICEMVSNDENPAPRYGKLYRCISGVFNSLEILSTSNQYKLSINMKDPFWLCRIQPEKYQEACFTQFVVAAMNVFNNDFVQVAREIDTIDDDLYAVPALQAMVVEFVKMGKTNYQETINFCHNLFNRFQTPCLTAFAEGFLKYGPPEKEYVEAINFCNSDLLGEQEKVGCFEKVLSLLRIWYTADKSRSICQGIDQKYRWQNCQYN